MHIIANKKNTIDQNQQQKITSDNKKAGSGLKRMAFKCKSCDKQLRQEYARKWWPIMA